MRVEPCGAELLKSARETLLEELLPLLPEEGRYAARMAANAMAIAARELAGEGGSAVEELARLKELLPGWAPSTSEPLQAMREATVELAAAIRAGRFDADGARAALAEYFRTTTQERLAVSNPRILSAAKP
jgi:transposase